MEFCETSRRKYEGAESRTFCFTIESIGARKRTRTSTPLRELRPERSASANSAIRAQASFYIAGFLSATNPASGRRSKWKS